MVDLPDFPTTLRVQRAARRLSQERAALALGMRFHRYRRLEAAMERPTPRELDKLALFFSVSAKALRASVSSTTYPTALGNGEAASVA